MRKMLPIKKQGFWFIAFILIMYAIVSCKESENIVNVRVDSVTDYPIIRIDNPYNEGIVFKPISKEKGSVGFEKEGEITWLSGAPERMVDEKKVTLAWTLEEGKKVYLSVTEKKDDLHFDLTLDSIREGIQPRKWLLNISAHPEEYFTGLLERVVDGPQSKSWAPGIETAMNLRGEKVGVKLKPTVSAYAPFYISSSNYGFFVQETWPGEIDFCKEEQNMVQIRFQGPDMAFKFYRADEPAKIIKRHALETGPSFVPPKWALGPWRWRDEHRNLETYYDGTPVNAPYNSQLVEDVLLMKAYDIPCTAYWIDRPWGPGKRGFDDYEFDKDRFPQPQKMIDWLKQNDMELIMWIAPFVMGDMAEVAAEKGWELKSNRWKDSRQALMDFTNPEAVEWWGENGPAKLARMGIKGFKLDRADGEKLLDSLTLRTHDGTTYRENFNDYPVQYVKAAYEAVKPVLGDDFLLFPRAQYTGSARYGGLWAGDTRSHAEGLRSAIIAMQRCAVMGYPMWGSDVGGYAGDFDREVTMRWLGLGCFSPLMEVGPTEDRGFWDSPDDPRFDSQLIATWRLYTKLRMKLIDYIYEASQKASETGLPVARPLFMENPGEEEAWQDWQTYKLGSDLLVSIIWEKGKTSHRMYLPAGEIWIDAWNTDKEYEGGKFVEVEAPMHKTPVFIRKGSGLKLGDLNKLYQESLEIAQQKFDLNKLEEQEGF